MDEIAVFPIPNCVAFPGAPYPLHVFEPRYRTMVMQCLDEQRPIAVCHVDKTLHEAPKMQSIDDALKSNQATYKPVPVVSAGQCELIKTLDDGRMFINVHLNHRYRLHQEVQSLPYLIYQAEPFHDVPMTDELQQQADELKDKLLHRLLALTADREPVHSMLSSSEWQEKSSNAFSFDIFNLLTTEADIMQDILSLESPVLRLEAALSLLKDVPAQL